MLVTSAAASVWLSVETILIAEETGINLTAAASVWLCVETARLNIPAQAFAAAASVRLCVETNRYRSHDLVL